MAGERADDLVDDLVVRHLARLHGEVGQRIDRIALVHQRPQRRARIVGLEQRTVVAALDAAHQHVEFGLEPDRDALGADRRAGVGVHEGAAAGRQHLRPAFEQARDHARLAGAEVGLAVRWRRYPGWSCRPPSRSRCRRRRTGCRAAARAAGRSTTCRRPSCRRARPSAARAPPRWPAPDRAASAISYVALPGMAPFCLRRPDRRSAVCVPAHGFTVKHR